MSESYQALRGLFSEAGYAFIEPAILHHAGVFVELAGEDLRRRLFLTAADGGTELALRPDYTIPVCLAHLAAGPAERRADYAYLGPVFRQRQDEPGEFLQAGVESIGRRDRAAADADMLQLALTAVDLLGVKRPSVRIGDSALFAALLAALDLAGPWRKRLGRAFGDPARLKLLRGRLAGGKAFNGDALPGSGGLPATRRAVETMLGEAGLLTVGGRSAGEIAARYIEKAALAAGTANRRAPKVLERFLAIAGPPGDAAKALRRLARAETLDLGRAIDQFERRLEGFSGRGIDVSRLIFAADFGRRLDYYTGFVFEIHDGVRAGSRQIIGGGRYDRLLGLMPRAGQPGTGGAVPAVGFSIWLDRIGGGA